MRVGPGFCVLQDWLGRRAVTTAGAPSWELKGEASCQNKSLWGLRRPIVRLWRAVVNVAVLTPRRVSSLLLASPREILAMALP